MEMYHLAFNVLTASVSFVTVLGSTTKIGSDHERRTRSGASHSEQDPLFAH